MNSSPYKDPKSALDTLHLIVELKVVDSIEEETAFKILDKPE